MAFMHSASADKGVVSPDMRNLIGAKAYVQQEDGTMHIALRRKSACDYPAETASLAGLIAAAHVGCAFVAADNRANQSRAAVSCDG